MIYAYARCSVNESEEEQRQLFTALQASGAEKGIIEYEENDPSDKVTLEMLLEYVRPGDTIITTQVSRLSRNTKHFCEVLNIVHHKRLQLIILGSIDVVVRVTEVTVESGKSVGRPRTKFEDIPPSFLKHYPALEQGLLNKSEMARVCGISRPTVYKYLRMMEK